MDLEKRDSKESGIGGGRKPGPGAETPMARRAFITGASAWGVSKMIPKEGAQKVAPGLVDVWRGLEALGQLALTGGSMYALLKKRAKMGKDRPNITIDEKAAEALLLPSLRHFQDFVERDGMHVFKAGTDREISDALAHAAELTAWMEAIRGTEFDIAPKFKKYPSVKLYAKAGRGESLDGLSVGFMEDKGSFETKISSGNGFVVRAASGRLYMTTCKHVADVLSTRGGWSVEDDHNIDVAVYPLQNRDEWEERAFEISSVRSRANPGSLNYFMSLNFGRKGTLAGALQSMGVALPLTTHFITYAAKHGSVRDKMPLEAQLIGRATEGIVSAAAKIDSMSAHPEIPAIIEGMQEKKFKGASRFMIVPPGLVSKINWLGNIAIDSSSGAPLVGLSPDKRPILNGFVSTVMAVQNDQRDIAYDLAAFIDGKCVIDLVEKAESRRS